MTVFAIIVLSVLSTGSQAEPPSGSSVGVLLSVGSDSCLDISLSGSFLCNGFSVTDGILHVKADHESVRAFHSIRGPLGSGRSLLLSSRNSSARMKLDNSLFGITEYSGSLLLTSENSCLHAVNLVPLEDYICRVLARFPGNALNEDSLKVFSIVCTSRIRCIPENDPVFSDDCPVFCGSIPSLCPAVQTVQSVRNRYLTCSGMPSSCNFCFCNGGFARIPGKEPGTWIELQDDYDLRSNPIHMSVCVPSDCSLASPELYDLLLSCAETVSAETDSVRTINSVTVRDMQPSEPEHTVFQFICNCGTLSGDTTEHLLEVPARTLAERFRIPEKCNRCFVSNDSSGDWRIDFTYCHGNGEGLSLTGMVARTESGSTWEDVLSFYYPGCVLSPE